MSSRTSLTSDAETTWLLSHTLDRSSLYLALLQSGIPSPSPPLDSFYYSPPLPKDDKGGSADADADADGMLFGITAAELEALTIHFAASATAIPDHTFSSHPVYTLDPDPIPAPSSSLPSIPSRPRHLFTYGTLRDDDNSGASWTKPFVKGSVAWDGECSGLLLFQRVSGAEYPGGELVEQDPAADERVPVAKGRILSWQEWEWDAPVFSSKLASADSIEAYDESDPEESFYLRSIVRVSIPNTHASVDAFVYHQTPKAYVDWTHRVFFSDWVSERTPIIRGTT